MEFKESIHRKKRISFGSWLQIGHPITTEIMAQSGFEWLVVDLEHSVIELSQAQVLFQVMRGYKIVPLARVASNDPVQIKRIMDAGASGVIVPNINSADEAKRAVAAVKYPPHGSRGVGLARAQGYGANFHGYYHRINSESIVMVQIEHRLAIDHLEEIARVGGLDGLFIGPFDLSASYGIAGQFEAPLMLKAMEKVKKCAHQANLALGIHVVYPDLNEVRRRVKQGFRFIAYSVDSILLQHYALDAVKRIKGLR